MVCLLALVFCTCNRMQLTGSKGENQAERAKAIVQAVAHYNDAQKLAEVSSNLGEAMVGLTISDNMKGGKLATRGW